MSGYAGKILRIDLKKRTKTVMATSDYDSGWVVMEWARQSFMTLQSGKRKSIGEDRRL